MFLVCIDVGKPGSNLGWAAADGDARYDGTDLDACVALLASALHKGPVSLGFESPLFIPIRNDPLTMTKSRRGESGPGIPTRPFSAGAGPTVTILGILTACYVLRRLRKFVPAATATMDWRNPPTTPGQVLIWEAFVTAQRKSHATRHVEDAYLALQTYQERQNRSALLTSSVIEPNCLSLMGAALLRTGWTKDINVLSEQCLVVRV
jgi:hypothetical protein